MRGAARGVTTRGAERYAGAIRGAEGANRGLDGATMRGAAGAARKAGAEGAARNAGAAGAARKAGAAGAARIAGAAGIPPFCALACVDRTGAAIRQIAAMRTVFVNMMPTPVAHPCLTFSCVFCSFRQLRFTAR